MKAWTILLVIFSLVSGALAGDANSPDKSAQAFYDGYIKILNANKDGEHYVMQSDRLTAALKKTYTAFMKDPPHDPIIDGQDFPQSGFKVSETKIEGETATLTMTSRDPKFTHSIKLHMVKKGGTWQISEIGSLKGR